MAARKGKATADPPAPTGVATIAGNVAVLDPPPDVADGVDVEVTTLERATVAAPGWPAEAPVQSGPHVVACQPGTISCEDGAELVAHADLLERGRLELRKYAIDDWRVVAVGSHGEEADSATVHQSMRAAWNRLNDAFRAAGLAWWTQRAE